MADAFSNLSSPYEAIFEAVFEAVLSTLYWCTTDWYLRVPATLAQDPFISVSLVSYLV